MARPPQYDCTEVLDKATKLFWEKGYRGVAVSDLVKATGLLPGSIYAKFGNKEGLYIACVQHYGTWAERLRGEFAANASPLERVRGFFLAMARQAATDPDHRGCFLVSASQECDEREPSVSRAVATCLTAGEEWLAAHLRAAQAAGQVAADLDVDTVVTCLQSALSGFRVLSRSGGDTSRIPLAAETLFTALVTGAAPISA